MSSRFRSNPTGQPVQFSPKQLFSTYSALAFRLVYCRPVALMRMMCQIFGVVVETLLRILDLSQSLAQSLAPSHSEYSLAALLEHLQKHLRRRMSPVAQARDSIPRESPWYEVKRPVIAQRAMRRLNL